MYVCVSIISFGYYACCSNSNLLTFKFAHILTVILMVVHNIRITHNIRIISFCCNYRYTKLPSLLKPVYSNYNKLLSI